MKRIEASEHLSPWMVAIPEMQITRADAVSFEAFYEANVDRVFGAMYLVCGSTHEAEDVVQEAFVRAYERWDQVMAAGNPEGYVYRIALNVHRGRLRRMAVAARKRLMLGRDQEKGDDMAEVEERAVLRRCLDALSPKLREALVLVEWLGLSDEEAGAVLGVRAVTVRVRCSRARAALRPIFEGEADG